MEWGKRKAGLTPTTNITERATMFLISFTKLRPIFPKEFGP